MSILYQYDKRVIETSSYINAGPLTVAYRPGRLDVVRWLFQIMKIRWFDAEPFIITCRDGHLKLAKYLYNFDRNSAFGAACEDGNIVNHC